MTCTNSLENRGVKEGYIFVDTNQDVLLFKLLTFWGVVTNQDMLLFKLFGGATNQGVLLLLTLWYICTFGFGFDIRFKARCFPCQIFGFDIK